MFCFLISDKNRSELYAPLISEEIGNIPKNIINSKQIRALLDYGSSNLGYIEYFVIDLEAWVGSWQDIKDAMGILFTMYPNAKRIMIVGKNSMYLINDLISDGLYNIINDYRPVISVEDQIKKCFSTVGMSKEDAQELLEPKKPEPKPITKIKEPETNVIPDNYKVEEESDILRSNLVIPSSADEVYLTTAAPSVTAQTQASIYSQPLQQEAITYKLRRKQSALNQRTQIAIVGLHHGIGTTHQAFLIASCFKSANYKVCILEANNHKSLVQMNTVYDVSDEIGHMKIKGIDLYYNYMISDVIEQGYEILVFDFGIYQNIVSNDNNWSSFLMKDIKIIVGGGKPWELNAYTNLYEKYNKLSDFSFIVNFTTRQEQEDVNQLLSKFKRQVYFGDYEPDFFTDKANNVIYSQIFSDFLALESNAVRQNYSSQSAYMESAVPVENDKNFFSRMKSLIKGKGVER